MSEPLVRRDLVAAQVKLALDLISQFCSDAFDAQNTASEGSAEWHKRTGEILAYALMTALLLRIEETAKTPSENWRYGVPN